MSIKDKTPFQSYEEAQSFLYKAIDYEKLISYQYNTSTFSLDRMIHMLEHVGNPHREFRSVHITGTKGKGSTSIMISAVLERAGLKTGLFTSPHLIDLKERIRINHQNISERDFTDALSSLQSYIQYLRDTNPPASPTFFEILTAAAMLYFRKRGVDMAVLEVGLGGRLDSTNVVIPLVSVITNVGLDHTAILGNTISRIAYEKAGIIKEGVPVISAAEAPEALSVLEKTCKEKNARMYLLGRDIFIENVRCVNGGQIAYCNHSKIKTIKNKTMGLLCTIKTWRHTYNDIFLPLVGAHQAKNCAAAIGAIEILKEQGNISIKDEIIRDALARVYCPARIEVVARNPLIILDFAHTVDSMQFLKKGLLENLKFRKLILVLGLAQDKDLDNILKEIAPVGDLIIVTKSKNPRAAAPEDLCQRIERLCGKQAKMMDNTQDAVIGAIQMASKEDLICITGSAYIAGEAKQTLDSSRVKEGKF